jgi:hypothetical protein
MTRQQIGLGTMGLAATAGAANTLELANLKKELKLLNNPTEAKKIYRDSGSEKPYSKWLSERKMYLNGQIKNLRYSNLGVVGATGLGAYNTLNKKGKYIAPNISNVNFNNFNINGRNVGKVSKNLAITGAGAAGSFYSFKTLVKNNKELKLLNNNSEAKKLYKQSGSKESFSIWKNNRINELKKQNKQLAIAAGASVFTTGLGAYNTVTSLKEDNYYNEAFYGKSNTMKEIEDELWEKLIYAVSHNENPYKYKNDIKKAEAKLEKYFNLEKLNIHIGSNYGVQNAFTINWINIASKTKKQNYDLVENSEGIKFKDSTDKKINIYMYPKLLTGELTKEEVNAIFLHEIGHNFFVRKEYIRYNSSKNIVDGILEITWKFLLNNSEGAFREYTKDLLEFLIETLFKMPLEFLPTKQKEFIYKTLVWLSNPGSYDIIGDKLQLNLTVFNKIIGGFREVFGAINKTLNIIFTPIKLVIKIILMKVIKSLFKDVGSAGLLTLDYQAEKYADAFAAKHGYGKDLYTGLEAISDNPMNSLDVLTSLSKIYTLFTSYMGMYFIDCHPSNITRCKKILELYKQELNKNGDKLNPKQKKEIQEQIKKMEKLMKVSSDKKILQKLELKLDSPFSKINEKKNNTLSGFDGTYA